ncbi:MAG: hypothetical protein GY716_10275 [bacterium]|nr:hypothetical protein [bacterium]
MQPTLGTVHTDLALTRLVTDYSPQQYIADVLFPWMKVDDETGFIWQVPRNRMSGFHPDTTGNRSLRSEDGTAKSLTGFGVTQGTYATSEYALNQILFDRIRDKADKPLRLRQRLSQQTQEQLMMDREHRCVTLAMTGANFATNHTAAAAALWTAAATDMTVDVDAAKTKIKEATLGKAKPQDLILVLNWDLWLAVKNNTDVKDRVKYSQTVKGSDITPELLAQYFDIGQVKIAGAYYNSAGEGLTESLTQFWTKSVVGIYYQEPVSESYQGMGLSFSTNPGGTRVRSWRDNPRKGEVMENEMVADEQIVNTGSGYVITAAAA